MERVAHRICPLCEACCGLELRVRDWRDLYSDPLRKQFPNVDVIPFADLDLNSGTLRKAAGAAMNR